MKLDDLLPNLGEWLRGTGPESDVVVSTRIRLARNLADLPFATRATTAHKAEVISRAKDAISKAGAAHQLEYADIPAMAALDRQFLVERQLISRELAGGLDGPRGVAFDPTETASVHGLFTSAVQLAENAALVRREAAVNGNMARAWDASSAAAGALMLLARAQADLAQALQAAMNQLAQSGELARIFAASKVSWRQP